MPELPEVESLKMSLIPFVVGQKILRVEVRKPKLVSARGTVRTESLEKLREFEAGLVDESITEIRRVAKNLIIIMGSGKALVVHLKMTGQLVYQGKSKTESSKAETKQELLDVQNENFNLHLETTKDGQATVWGGHPIELSGLELPNKHSHIIFRLERGTLYFNDTRMFGYVLYYSNIKSAYLDGNFEKYGLEPLSEDFTLQTFRDRLTKKSGVLKAVFLNQEVVTGLGNIYADEVCFDAGVRPTRLVKTLKPKEIERLFHSISKIIPLAVAEGGSSVANYLMADGSRGNYAKLHQVYNRGGKPCYKCGRELTSLKLAGRTTVYCQFDQR
jgi:formamidopyrimidine-DNA glycosylase